MDAFCFIYKQVDGLYTLFKYRFIWKIVARSRQVFDFEQKALYFNERNRRVEKKPGTAQKILLR